MSSSPVLGPGGVVRTNWWFALGSDSPRWAVAVALVSCYPLATPYGTLFPIEGILVVCAFLQVIHKGPNLRVSPAAIGVLLLLGYLILLAASPSDLLGTLRGPGRALAVLAAALLLIDNAGAHGYWQRLMQPAAAGVMVMLAAEVVMGHPLIGGAAVGYLAQDTLRVQGPMGSGPVAAALMSACFLAVRSRSWIWMAILICGVVVTGSRTHVIALALMLVLMSVASLKRLLGATIAFGVALAVVVNLLPGMGERLLFADSSLGGRADIWPEAWRQSVDSWPYGQPSGLIDGLFQAHNQFLSLLLLGGVVGLTAVIFLNVEFLRRATFSSSLALAIPLVITGATGEFLVPIIPFEAVGVVFAWFAVGNSGASDIGGVDPLHHWSNGNAPRQSASRDSNIPA